MSIPDFRTFFSQPLVTTIMFLVVMVWEFAWRGFGLWKASKNNQRNWFIAMLVVNSIGVLPIIYLKFFSKKD